MHVVMRMRKHKILKILKSSKKLYFYFPYLHPKTTYHSKVTEQKYFVFHIKGNSIPAIYDLKNIEFTKEGCGDIKYFYPIPEPIPKYATVKQL